MLPRHILVIRLSAPGDVAMTVPVLHSFQKAYPLVKLTVLTQKKMAPLFQGLNATLFFAETKSTHKGFMGLITLFRQLNATNSKMPVDGVADLHNVLRSQVLRRLYQFAGIAVACINKGRAEKKLLTRKKNKVLQPLPDSFQRYKNVFRELGFDFSFDFHSIFTGHPLLPASVREVCGSENQKWIGIAPFAAYKEKTYPPEKMEEVVAQLSAPGNVKIFFFGSPTDAAIFNRWERQYPGSINVAGKFSLADELLLMAHLDVMVSMDSANMHFASLVAVPVVSVWGATHPYAGFLGWNQSEKNIVQAHLSCRPCSVFGNKPCYRGDLACMNLILPDVIVKTVNEVLAG